MLALKGFMIVRKGTDTQMDTQMDTRGGNVCTVSSTLATSFSQWLPYNSTPQGFMADYLQEEL